MSSASTINSILSTSQLPQIGLTDNTPTSLSSTLALSGLASGMNWQSTVQALANAERAPETQWQQQQTSLNSQNSAFTAIKNDLSTLQTDLKTLQDSSLYQSATAQSSDSAVATASAASGATLGTYNFNISQLATAAQINGATGISQVLAPGGNLSSVTIGTAGFSTPVTAGTFTINGYQVNIATTDSLQDVFNNIASATGNTVTASYNASTDEITLSSTSGSLVLGSAADTSNFLQVAQLYNNGTSSVTSASALGRVNLTVSMSSSDLATPVSDGGSGNGAFVINGVTINYNASTDSIQNVLDRINNSAAGVTVNYDSVNNRFILKNNTTGDVGVSMQDVAGQGNFLAATGLSSGALQRGQNLLYTVNNSPQLTSQSNIITSASSGITGLTVNALATGSTTVTVSGDTSKISSAIQQFISDYNSVQNYISAQQLVTTNSDGTVTPGTLTGDLTATDIANNLRSLSFSAGSGFTGSITNLGSLGIQTNGQDNTLALSDSTALDDAIANNPNAIQSFFSDATYGVATQLNNYITNITGDNGELTNHQADLTTQYNNLSTQISNLETKITADSKQWTQEFQAMEQAQSQVNQELTYLSEQVSNGNL